MTVRCASCGRRLRGILPRTSWCPECKTLSCDMCRPSDYNSCPVCGTEIHGKDYFAIFFAVSTTMMVVTLVFSGLSIMDLSKQIPAEAMPISAIDGLHPGEHVKIQGTLEGNGTIAIDGAMADDEWEFTTESVMLRSLNDNAGILLVISPDSDISRGPHRSEKPQDSGHSVYWTNDTIVAVGTTAKNGTNDTVLRVELLRPYNGSFVSGFSLWTGIYIPLIIWMAIAFFLAFNLRLKRTSERTIDSPGFVFKKRTLMDYQPSVMSTVVVNSKRNTNKIVLMVLIAIDALMTFTYFMLFSIGFLSIYNTRDVMIATFIPFIFPVCFTIMFIKEYRNSPISVLIDKTGFELDYGHRIEGYRWADIGSLEAPYRDSKSRMIRDPLIEMTLEDDRKTVFGNISEEVSDSLTGRFKQERPDAEPDDILDLLVDAENQIRKAEPKKQATEGFPNAKHIQHEKENLVPGRFMNNIQKKTSRKMFWTFWILLIVLIAVLIVVMLFARGDVLDVIVVFAVVIGILLPLTMVFSITYWSELSDLVEWMELSDSGLSIKFAIGRVKNYPWTAIKSLSIMERDEKLPASSTGMIISVPKNFFILRPIEQKLAETARKWYEQKGENEHLRLMRKLESAKDKGATPLELVGMLREGVEEIREKEKKSR